MGAFNTTKFMKQEFQPRTAELELSAFEPWFNFEEDDEEKKCIFVVRGLNANEMSQCINASINAKNLSTIVEAIGNKQEAISEIRKSVGLTDENTADVQKRLKQLELGSVEPKLEMNEVVNLANKFPVEFFLLTHKITELTGLGMDIKK